MRFIMGISVEVFTKKKVHFGTWRCAEFVAGNGDSCKVRYYDDFGFPKKRVHKVTAEDIRPCPPPMTGSTTWGVGDVVEVLDDGYWKVSMIMEVFPDGFCEIRVIGSVGKLYVWKSSIRVRQEWKKDKWLLKEKNSGDCEDMNQKITRMCKRIRIQPQQYDHDHSDSVLKSLKRSPCDFSSGSNDYSECIRKRRAVNKETDVDAIPTDCYSFIGIGDVPALTMGNQDKPIACNKKNGRNYDETLSLDKIPKPAVSAISSVGSCYVIDATHDRALSHFSTSCSQDMDMLSSDAESTNPMRYEEGVSVNISHRNFEEVLEASNFDLHSYRRILETLYASGPLSWEEEVSLTDLRMKYCVSNDEHLLELRRLKCVGGLGLSCY